MKRIKKMFVSALVALAVGAIGAGPASAGSVDMQIKLTASGFTLIECDATFATTTLVPPPPSIRILASSMVGTPGSANPCPPDVSVDNNPTVTFGGMTPPYALFNRFTVSESSTSGGCQWSADSVLTEAPSIGSPYSGSKGATTTTGCLFFPLAHLSLTGVVFY